MSTPICFLDTETDGVNPWRKPWEIAAIRRDDAGERRLHLFVEIDLSTADPYGLRVGRFWGRHPLGQWLGSMPDPNQDLWRQAHPPAPQLLMLDAQQGEPMYVTRKVAAGLVARWTYGAHVVGAVPNFDTEILDDLIRTAKFAPAHHYHLVDVENLALGWLHGRASAGLGDRPAGPPWSSEELSRLCGVEPAVEEQRHTALGDAEWAMRLYDAVTGTAAT